MAKRGRNEGSIFFNKRTKKWIGQMPDGTRKRQRISKSFDTQKEALRWVNQTKKQVQEGLTYDGSKVRFVDYIEDWINSKSDLRPSTLHHYWIVIDNYILPQLGRYLLKDLNGYTIQHVYDRWLAGGVKPYTVKKIHQVIHLCLARAYETGLVEYNAAEKVTSPKPIEKEMKIWTEDQAIKFLETVKKQGDPSHKFSWRLYCLFQLALFTGMRQGELLGLKWEDVDWINRTISVKRQLARYGENQYLPPKTKAGKRTIDLANESINALKNHVELQKVMKKKAGESWQENGLIFTTRDGLPIRPANLLKNYFKPMMKAAGVPEIRFHDMRHTAASIMLNRGVPVIVVSKYLGHAKPSITSNIYGHLMPEFSTQITQIMDEIFKTNDQVYTENSDFQKNSL